MTSQELLERVVELAAECRDDGIHGAEFVSTVAYGLGHVSQFSAPNKDAVMDLIETAVTEAYKTRAIADDRLKEVFGIDDEQLPGLLEKRRKE